MNKTKMIEQTSTLKILNDIFLCFKKISYITRLTIKRM